MAQDDHKGFSGNPSNTDRVILHCDCNSFYASAESIEHPEYRERPMAVAGDPQSRHGIILAKNELAKKYNITTAETIYSALRKCPDLLLVKPHHDLYERLSRQINAIYLEYTDRVEPFSIDESWLDVTASVSLKGTGREIADTLRKRIREEVGVTISAGVSFNKLFAKMGSDYKKPDATTVITRENYQKLLWPLPVENMMFVGKSTAAKLKEQKIYTIGDLAGTPLAQLQKWLGESAVGLWRGANGLEDSPVALYGEREDPKSFSSMNTFPKDLYSEEEVRRELLRTADGLASRLRQHGFYAYVVSVTVKDPDLKTRQKQKKRTDPTNLAREIYMDSWQLIQRLWRPGQPIRMITVAVSGLSGQRGRQTSLFEDPAAQDKQESLEQTMDAIRQRYGKNIVRYARMSEGNGKKR